MIITSSPAGTEQWVHAAFPLPTVARNRSSYKSAFTPYLCRLALRALENQEVLARKERMLLGELVACALHLHFHALGLDAHGLRGAFGGVHAEVDDRHAPARLQAACEA